MENEELLLQTEQGNLFDVRQNKIFSFNCSINLLATKLVTPTCKISMKLATWRTKLIAPTTTKLKSRSPKKLVNKQLELENYCELINISEVTSSIFGLNFLNFICIMYFFFIMCVGLEIVLALCDRPKCIH